MTEILTTAGGILAPIITAIAGWFFSKRQTRAKAKALELQNKRTEIDIYQDTISNFDKLLHVRDEAINELKNQLNTLLEQNRQLIAQNNELLKKVSHMESEQNGLINSYKELEKQYKSLLKS